MLADVVDGADVRVVERGRRLGLALEAAQGLGILGDVVRQELQGDKTVEARIFRLVDHTHAATAQLLDDAVVRNGLAKHWRESYVCESAKSMKAGDFVVGQAGWRRVAIALI